MIVGYVLCLCVVVLPSASCASVLVIHVCVASVRNCAPPICLRLCKKEKQTRRNTVLYARAAAFAKHNLLLRSQSTTYYLLEARLFLERIEETKKKEKKASFSLASAFCA